MCDLVGLFILSQLEDIIPNVGLYRDDRLAVSSANSRQIENMKKNIFKEYQDNGLAVIIEANSKAVNFLNVTFDLNSGIYKPCIKDNDILTTGPAQSLANMCEISRTMGSNIPYILPINQKYRICLKENFIKQR